MDNREITTAIELGARCRRFRNALGLSQQALGDKVKMTGAAISKYEKEGIYNIEILQELSNALGHDLMTDEIDEEGTVGEIGKEILRRIVSGTPFFHGIVDAIEIINSEAFYGLSIDRIIKEIFKLEKIGLCVREQYIDFSGIEQDKIFLTAKGRIVYNTLPKIIDIDEDDDIRSNPCITYEKVCHGHINYQDFIDSSIVEKKIRNLNPSTGFRAGFISYLLDNHTSLFIEPCANSIVSEYIRNKNIYETILYSMIIGLTNDDINLIVELNHLRGGFYSEACNIIEDKIIEDNMEYDFLIELPSSYE